ncbi:hypothetical protein OJF2_76030 [Aquisphaera giovannonii]|uniref:Uncharacterized protein n=1 Tax=Aquisphaera giovannonii TaxID=406548 RepID=A0A5B9WG56_9BACT|nr:hypothetical protein [Aquisphaera giovannonii]QEH38991.1 hypothetical protein OJF2_76030 [Aquisphaera giovannonii]
MDTELYINEQGRFQIASEELAGFVAYLRENAVPCDVQPAERVQAGGRSYGVIRLQHLYDTDTARGLYRTWRQAAAV